MKYFLTLVLLIVVQSVNAQYLDLDQLVNLQSKDVKTLNQFLINKGWELNSSEPETEGKMGEAVWAYAKADYDAERAIAWFNLNYSQNYQSSVVYQMHSESHYMLIKNRMTALGMKLVNSQRTDEGMRSVYLGDLYVVKVIVSPAKEESSAKFLFTIVTKEVYFESLE